MVNYLLVRHLLRVNGEELIEGVDLLSKDHQKLKRANPQDAILIAGDIRTQLEKRKVPTQTIDQIIVQFIKDCFKLAYMEMFDRHNTNYGILYAGLHKARIAPLYDLDLGFRPTVEFVPDIDTLNQEKICQDMREMTLPDYLPNYIETINKVFPWFANWVKLWTKRLSCIDLETILVKDDGIKLEPGQIEYYMEFISEKNTIIENYFKKRAPTER